MAEKGNAALAGLLQVQMALKAPKSQYNKFGKYNYRNCEDIIEAVKPLLKENGLFLTMSDDIVQIGDRYYVKAVVSVTDIVTGESVQTSALAREAAQKKGMDESQVTGTASSYARKYALNGLFAIDDTKDADTDEYTARTSAQNAAGRTKTTNTINHTSQPPKPSQRELELKAALSELNAEIKRLGLTGADASKVASQYLGKSTIKAMSVDEVKTLATNFESWAKELK